MIDFLSVISDLVIWAFGYTVFAIFALGFLYLLYDGYKKFREYLQLRAARKEMLVSYCRTDVDTTLRMYESKPMKAKDVFRTAEEIRNDFA